MYIQIKSNKVLVNITAEEINKSYGTTDAEDLNIATDISEDAQYANEELLSQLFQTALDLKDLYSAKEDYSMLLIHLGYKEECFEIFNRLVRGKLKITKPDIKNCEDIINTLNDTENLLYILKYHSLEHGINWLFKKANLNPKQMAPLKSCMKAEDNKLTDFMFNLYEYAKSVLKNN